MRVVRPVFVLAAAVGLAAVSAQAQTCRGFSSLDKAKMNVGANAWFADGATSFGGQLNMRHVGMGMNHTLALGVGATSYDYTGAESQMNLNFGLGVEKKTNDIEWCPEFMVGYSTNAGGFKDASNLGLGVGLGIGKSMGKMGGFELVPFGGVNWVHSSYDSGISGASSVSDNAFDFGAGLGLRLESGIQLSPQFSKSSTSGSKALFGVTASFPFGGK